ncbi:SMI1/KNR4 family protein [Tsukamurella sp. M9C]|uniref:SMI1/KNR4 family protein n=1 Tax=unclassified Tsukamurella TaxID=2633480 RepID=UPI001CCE5E5D|nr:SMI1/KNR4 family protein [Tsukamurella sp. M9C]MCA0158770.1 SMI1/KNR4 family protein [Tsukamurella sp. M9C]
MNTDVGVARWRELIDAFLEQRERLIRIHPDLYEMSQPNPGATEEQLLAAEARLGHRIPAQYREFLAVADGWSEWNSDVSLLSCAEIGHGTISETEGLGIRLAEGDVLVNWSTDVDWIRIADSEGTYWETFLLHRDSQGYRAGQLMMTPHGDHFYESFEQYLVEELADLTTMLDGEELGPHGKYWGRDLRLDPPTMQQIVERLAALRVEFAELCSDPAPGSPNPGAAPSDIATLEGHLGRPLHREHRELLEVADGWPGNPRILSCAEIIAGDAWAETLAARDRHNDWQAADFARCGVSTWQKPGPAADAADTVSVTPFATQVIAVWGIDTDDGSVLDVLTYVEDVARGYKRSYGTVREHLLSQIDGLCQQIESWRRTFR